MKKILFILLAIVFFDFFSYIIQKAAHYWNDYPLPTITLPRGNYEFRKKGSYLKYYYINWKNNKVTKASNDKVELEGGISYAHIEVGKDKLYIYTNINGVFGFLSIEPKFLFSSIELERLNNNFNSTNWVMIPGKVKDIFFIINFEDTTYYVYDINKNSKIQLKPLPGQKEIYFDFKYRHLQLKDPNFFGIFNDYSEFNEEGQNVNAIQSWLFHLNYFS